jgi:transposase
MSILDTLPELKDMNREQKALLLQRMRELRADGWPNEDVGFIVGVSKATVSRWLRRGVPRG